MGRSNTAATLATSAVAIAPASHLHPRVRNVIDAGCHSRTSVPAGGRPAEVGVDQVRLNSSLGKWWKGRNQYSLAKLLCTKGFANRSVFHTSRNTIKRSRHRYEARIEKCR